MHALSLSIIRLASLSLCKTVKSTFLIYKYTFLEQTGETEHFKIEGSFRYLINHIYFMFFVFHLQRKLFPDNVFNLLHCCFSSCQKTKQGSCQTDTFIYGMVHTVFKPSTLPLCSSALFLLLFWTSETSS